MVCEIDEERKYVKNQKKKCMHKKCLKYINKLYPKLTAHLILLFIISGWLKFS